MSTNWNTGIKLFLSICLCHLTAVTPTCVSTFCGFSVCCFSSRSGRGLRPLIVALTGNFAIVFFYTCDTALAIQLAMFQLERKTCILCPYQFIYWTIKTVEFVSGKFHGFDWPQGKPRRSHLNCGASSKFVSSSIPS